MSAVTGSPGGTMIRLLVGTVEQLPVDGVALMKISPSGSVSEIVTSSAALRPSAVVVAVMT